MKESQFKRINPFGLAKQEAELKGELSLAGMKRLLPLLSGTEGSIEYDLHFTQGELRKPYIHGIISAQVPLMCQRCGQEFQYQLSTEANLQLVKSDAEAVKVSDPYEPLLVDEDHSVDLGELVQEEIILALPMFAKHPEGQCKE